MSGPLRQKSPKGCIFAPQKALATSTLPAHFALFAVALIYGANYTIAKIVMGDGYLQPLAFILLRVISGVVLFSLFHRVFVREKIDRADLGRLALCGLLGIAANQMLFFSGLSLTTPINASLIMTTTPILVLLASATLLGEAVTGRKIVGIAVGASGAILLIAQGGALSFKGDEALGNLLVFLNASSYGTYLVLVKKLAQKYQAITVVKWVFLFGALFVIPFGWPQLAQTEWHTFSLPIWLSVAYVLIFTTFFAYLFNAYALKSLNASVVSIYIYLQPLLAAVIALAFGQEELSVVKLLSGALIFSGVYLVSFRAQGGRRKLEKASV